MPYSICKKLFPAYLHPYAKSLLIYGLVGYAIRIIVAPITWLPQDFMATTWNQYVIVNHGIFDYFHFYPSVVTPTFSYLYVPFMKIVDVLVPGFYEPYITSFVAGHPVLYPSFPDFDWYFFTKVASDPRIFQFLLLTKLPVLIFDYGIALILVRLVTKPDKSRSAYKLWMLNPFTIYTVFMMGELHVLISIFLLVLGLYLATKSPGWKSALVLGASALIWHLALVFIPILSLFMRKKKGALYPLKFLMISILPWLAQALALQLLLRGEAIAGYRPGVLFASPFINQSAYIDLSAGFKLVLFPMLYGLAVLFLIIRPRIKPRDAWLFMISFFAIFYSTLLFHPHWIMWFTPFVILLMVRTESWLVNSLYLVCIILYSFYLIYWDSAVTNALFMPLSPEIWMKSGPQTLLNRYGGPGFGLAVMNGARALLSAVFIFLGWVAFKEMRTQQSKGGEE